MQQLIMEFLEALKLNKRPAVQDCKIYGQYKNETADFLYNDDKKIYERRYCYPETKRVRSAYAFVTAINEELRRRNNEIGEYATVHLNLTGGKFFPDDNFGRTIIHYDRLNSQQWELVAGCLNKSYNHREFLLLLQALKPSIPDFHKVFVNFSTIRIIGNSQLTSNPIITEEGQSEGFQCTYRLEDGTDGEERFPTGIVLDVPFAKAGDKIYHIPLDFLYYRNDEDRLKIQITCPEFENIEEQAIKDESEYIIENTTSAEKLLVLADF